MRQRHDRMEMRLRVLILGGVVSAGLCGCAPGGAVSPGPDPTPLTSASPSAAALDGDPADDLAVFAAVVQRVWDADRSVAGRDYVDALAQAGFASSAMEVTFDRTSVGDPADSIQFSVRVDEGCLVGQVGPSVAGPVTRLLPVTPGDTCLLGRTRPIDW